MKIDLITTESEHIALSQVMRKVINFTALMKEVSFTLDLHLTKTEVFVMSSKTIEFAFSLHSPKKLHR